MDFDNQELVTGFRSWFGGILCLDWSPDGRYIVAGGEVSPNNIMVTDEFFPIFLPGAKSLCEERKHQIFGVRPKILELPEGFPKMFAVIRWTLAESAPDLLHSYPLMNLVWSVSCKGLAYSVNR